MKKPRYEVWPVQDGFLIREYVMHPTKGVRMRRLEKLTDCTHEEAAKQVAKLNREATEVLSERQKMKRATRAAHIEAVKVEQKKRKAQRERAATILNALRAA